MHWRESSYMRFTLYIYSLYIRASVQCDGYFLPLADSALTQIVQGLRAR